MRSSDRTFFPLPRLHRLFAVSSAVLLVVSVWMVVVDHARPWRTYQRTYREQIDPWTTAARLREAQQAEQGREAAELQRQLDVQHPSLAKRLLGLPLIDCLGRPLGVEQIWLPELHIDYHFRAVARFDRCTTCHQAIDKSAHGQPGQGAYPSEQLVRLQLVAARTASDGAGQGGDRLLSAYGFALADHGMLDAAAPTIGLVVPRSPAAKAGLDVGDILLRIGERQVTNRTAALALFAQNVSRDKPLTVQVRRGLGQPYASHPRLDLFVGPQSPHPAAEFGCTVCHEGQGSATDFTFAAHSPNTPEQRADWRRRLAWRHDTNWDFPMLPARLVESSCLKCHSQASDLEPSRRYPAPPAAKLLAGYQLVRQLGCVGCHEVPGFDNRGRLGPSLRHVAERLDFSYLVEHAADPARLQPGSRMPRLFGINEHLEGQTHADTTRREQTEQRAIAAYLLSVSENKKLVPPPAEVTEPPMAERGQRLFRMQGCLACHQHEAMPEGQSVVGPNLSHLGAKYPTATARAWLTSWIRNPAHHTPRTAMPRVPLELQKLPESTAARPRMADPAADLAAWLASTGKPPRPQSRAAGLEALGKATIGKRGCYGCHDIPGFENVQPIGPALTDWGRKPVSLLAFDHVGELVARTQRTATFFRDALLAHRREGFLWQKLSAPRSFDYGKEKPFDQQLLMGRFTLTDAEREAIVTFVLGLVAQPPAPRYLPRPGPRQRALLDGRKLIDHYGCAECHTLELERWTLRYDPQEQRVPPRSADEFAFLAPHLPAETVATSRTADRRGLAQVQVTGMPRVDAQGRLQEDEDDEGQPVYGFTLWEPAAVGGHVWRVGGPDLLVPKSQLAVRREPTGGNYARLLYPLVLAEARAAGSSAVGQEAWGWLPPPLAHIGQAVQPQWMYGYLLRPTVIRPAAVLRMPHFNLTTDEARRLADYFAALSGAEFPYAAQAATQPATLAEAHDRRARYHQAAKLLVDRTTYCAKCHLIGDSSPGGENRTVLAPALDQVGRRIRPEHLRRWLASPKSALPYTAMPANFPPTGAPLGQDLYRGTSLEQLDAVLDLLLNYDWYLGHKSAEP
jgi:cytochrome c551/c552